MKYLARCIFTKKGQQYAWEMSEELFEKARKALKKNQEIYALAENREGYALCRVIKLTCNPDSNREYKNVIKILTKEELLKIFGIEDINKELGFGIVND